MKTINIGVARRTDINARVKSVVAGTRQGLHYSFPSVDIMHRVLTPNRWRILKTMMGAGPVGIRELARYMQRDVKAVHTDVHALIKAGIIQRTKDGKMEFPFDAVHVDFIVRAA